MKIGERGQVTIPQHLRERFGFAPDTEVEFIVRDEALLPVKKGQHEQVNALYGRKRFERSTDERMKLLRE